ncbi:MAG TPA: Sua5/YciO/YrdC/YwlC family protein [Solirubrobacteraceae bacterium]|nr:Sua5/YciO/YrdC/YwlC family protein [Solirubrobacteraceae bacterium]
MGVTAGAQAESFERCMSVGGVAVFPADTVYGLACDVHNRMAVERLYRLKRRRLDKPSAVMFFDRDLALAALPELGARTRSALERLLPGAVTALLPNPEGRFPLACGDDLSTFGLRVPFVPALSGVAWPVLQSSANVAGGPDARRLDEVPEAIRRAADLLLEGGALPGTSSTVIDLRRYEAEHRWEIVRAGMVSEREVAAALDWQFHFDPSTYTEMIREDIPVYEELQETLVRASGRGAGRVLELGTGTGETMRRLLERHPDADVVGIDESEAMLAEARRRLPPDRVSLRVARIQHPLPEGSFDLVASALCIHHLSGEEKRELFARIREALSPGGRFVLADVIVPDDPAEAEISLTPGWDHPSPLEHQLRWLDEVGFDARVVWEHQDLAVITAEVRG